MSTKSGGKRKAKTGRFLTQSYGRPFRRDRQSFVINLTLVRSRSRSLRLEITWDRVHWPSRVTKRTKSDLSLPISSCETHDLANQAKTSFPRSPLEILFWEWNISSLSVHWPLKMGRLSRRTKKMVHCWIYEVVVVLLVWMCVHVSSAFCPKKCTCSSNEIVCRRIGLTAMPSELLSLSDTSLLKNYTKMWVTNWLVSFSQSALANLHCKSTNP